MRSVEDNKVTTATPNLPPSAANIPVTMASMSSSSSTMSSASLGSVDYESLMSRSIDCPLGGVAEVMRDAGRGLLSVMPNDTLESCIPKLSKVTGLPVLSETGKVVGVISRKASAATLSRSSFILSQRFSFPSTVLPLLRRTLSVCARPRAAFWPPWGLR